jgi:hypothetical protein
MENLNNFISTPLICPLELPIANLPSLIREGTEQFSSEQERHLFVYSTLVTLSGTLTKIKGTYAKNTTYSNLFFMGIAPAASGKSVMLFPKMFINPIHKQFLLDSQIKMREFKKLAKKKSGVTTSSTEYPAHKVVLIPANCSSSKLMQHLTDNSPDVPAVMIESEIDTMANTNSTDFGNYSDILRKILHNEPISLSRKTNNEYYEVQSPKMSLLLSGTPGQVFKLINNKEDGLFSRFLIMAFNTNDGWKSMGPSANSVNLTDFFEEQAKEYFKIWQFNSKQELVVLLSQKQWIAFDEYFTEKYSETRSRHGADATSVVKRHGLMIFKLCMVLTGVRRYEEQQEGTIMTCRDEDFLTALFLIDLSLYSSLEVYETLPGVKTPNLNRKKEAFFQSLPAEFGRASAITKAADFKIGVRSADRYLKDWIQSKLLSQPNNGQYVKC